MRINQNIVDEQKAKWTYRRRLLQIATGLVFAIGVLAVVQWATGTRGWDLTAGLLTIVMVVLGFVLAGILLGILRGRPLTAEDVTEVNSDPKPFWERMDEESLENDPHVIGSKMYRIHDD